MLWIDLRMMNCGKQKAKKKTTLSKMKKMIIMMSSLDAQRKNFMKILEEKATRRTLMDFEREFIHDVIFLYREMHSISGVLLIALVFWRHVL